MSKYRRVEVDEVNCDECILFGKEYEDGCGCDSVRDTGQECEEDGKHYIFKEEPEVLVDMPSAIMASIKLGYLCLLFGWQGGTRWQTVKELHAIFRRGPTRSNDIRRFYECKGGCIVLARTKGKHPSYVAINHEPDQIIKIPAEGYGDEDRLPSNSENVRDIEQLTADMQEAVELLEQHDEDPKVESFLMRVSGKVRDSR